jgi:hypothetical protein
MFERENLFDEIMPDLVLRGLLLSERMNSEQPDARAGEKSSAARAAAT